VNVSTTSNSESERVSSSLIVDEAVVYCVNNLRGVDMGGAEAEG
jgi:hypothetical protein